MEKAEQAMKYTRGQKYIASVVLSTTIENEWEKLREVKLNYFRLPTLTKKCIACKSLWIKGSAKCINVNTAIIHLGCISQTHCKPQLIVAPLVSMGLRRCN